MDAAQKPIAPPYQWNILRIMVIIAALAPLLALTRYPFALGLFTYAGSIALFVTLSIRRRCYNLVAWLLILYPVIPLLVMYIHWLLATRRIVRRSTPLFDGLLGFSDIIGVFCIIAYFACVVIATRSGGVPELKRAAKWVVFVMPLSWTALVAFVIIDPLGMIAYFFRF
jgi:hypothetical protein